MARMIEIDFSPDEATLRQFGWIALVGFGILAALAWTETLIFAFGLGEWRVPVTQGLLAVGVVAAFLGFVAPKANRWLFVGLSLLAFPIGFVLSYLLLGTLFFLVITPTAIGMKMARHDPLQRDVDPDATTYWQPARPTPDAERYFRQF